LITPGMCRCITCPNLDMMINCDFIMYLLELLLLLCLSCCCQSLPDPSLQTKISELNFSRLYYNTQLNKFPNVTKRMPKLMCLKSAHFSQRQIHPSTLMEMGKKNNQMIFILQCVYPTGYREKQNWAGWWWGSIWGLWAAVYTNLKKEWWYHVRYHINRSQPCHCRGGMMMKCMMQYVACGLMPTDCLLLWYSGWIHLPDY
jgi:hypothetical protein